MVWCGNKQFIDRWQKWLCAVSLLYKRKQRKFQENETEKKNNTERERNSLEQALYTEGKRKYRKEAHYHFLVARADDDRPVSVPVGSCCLELLDAVCGGCIWWISFEVRR